MRIRVPAERSGLESIARLPGVLGIGAIPPEIKADEAFVQEMRSRAAGEQAPVYITLMAPDPAGEWRRALSGLGAVVGAYDSDLRSYTANLSASALAEVLRADFVMYVEPVPVVTANHDSAMPVMGVDGVRNYDSATDRFTGVTGSGIAVGVLDTGLNIGHMDIAYGRGSICGANFVPDETWDLWVDLHGHGTHVFGTIASAGRTDRVLAGAAPNLSHLRFGKVLSSRGGGSGDDIRRGMDYFAHPSGCMWQGEQAEAVKPSIVNMSLAATSLTFSGRGVGERKLDSVVHAYSQLYVVAQANSSLHGFSNYGTAKNSLSVGAVEDTGIIARFSSHGPTADGRLAPNVVGTGVGITSPRGGASVSSQNTWSGTSMASPSVAGVAALLMEARPEFQNQPALARARLMASAIRPGAYLESRAQLPADNTDGPGGFQNLYGLGLVSARTSLYSHDDPSGWLIGSATAQPENGAYEYIDIEVPEDAGRLDVVMTWDEQPADTLTRSVLNNLDLYADRGADCGADACGEYASRSEVDNVEWLLIEDPAPGIYRIKIVPVEIYGESNVAAVAWKILRGEAPLRLVLDVEETSPSGAGDDYFTIDVTVKATSHVASGTTIHLNCHTEQECNNLRNAFLPRRTQVYRGDGLSRPLSHEFFEWRSSTRNSRPIPVGEVAVGEPRRVQLWFQRERIAPGTALSVTATSWNAKAASRTLSLASDGSETETETEIAVPANDSFSAYQPISGAAGETRVELALASREPGEPLVDAAARTVWYIWEAPTRGLYRFRVREADTEEPRSVEFTLFTGGNLVELEPAVQKIGSEISFDAEAGTRYRLRIASSAWHAAPLVLEWEAADARPANDDFTEAEAIEGESGSLDSSNEGATLERLEFWGGYASTVWYAWTAPADGFARFTVDPRELHVLAFAGSEIGGLRLVSRPNPDRSADFAVRSGETYRLAVAARDADASGTPFTLTWEMPDSDRYARYSYNDYFSEADSIGGREGIIHGLYFSDSGSRPLTVEPSEPSESGVGTRWWYWTAPEDGRFTWRLDAPEAFRLNIFTGDALDNLQLVASLRGGSTAVLDVTGNTRYWISTGLSPDGIGASVSNAYYSSSFTWGLTPGNDNRADALRLTGASGSVDASLIFATAEAGEPRSTVGLESVWWNWSAPTTGWRRFWVDGHPLHAIVSIYPGRDAGTQPSQVIGSSERSYLANGLVEVVLYAQAGVQYDIRLSRRPGANLQRSLTLRWSASEAPAYLSYKTAVTDASMTGNPVVRGLHRPHNVAVSKDGHYLFSSADRQLYAFLRDPDSGEIAVAHIAASESNRDTVDRGKLRYQAHLWWNPLHDRLFAVWPYTGHSFAVPDEGSLLNHQSVAIDASPTNHWSYAPTVGTPDGRHLYQINGTMRTLEVRRADSPAQLTLVQIVSPHDIDRDDQLVIPNLTEPVDVTLSPDGLHLYLVDWRGLFVFSRDTSSGMLEPRRGILHGSDPDGPFYEMGNLRNAALDANASILFVSGAQSRSGAVFDSAIAAFDVSADLSDPEHLDTLTGFFFEHDRDATAIPNHLKPWRNSLRDCEHLLPHADLVAVDVFCESGYFVVRWNPETGALEVTDFAVTGAEDRFGNKLPPYLGDKSRQMANSPDGKHAYRANDSSLYNAINIFERAAAMAPD